MMKAHTGWHFYNPVRIHYGLGMLNDLKRFCVKGKNILLVTSQGFLSRGKVDLVKALLKNKNVSVLSSVEQNPSLAFLKDVYSSAGDSDFIVGLGGGSVLDTVKCLAVRCASFNELRDFIIEKKNMSYVRIPCIAVPTTAGTGSEVTSWASVWDKVNKRKYSLELPDLWYSDAVIDPQLTMTMPCQLTVSTGIDALSHAFESLWNKNNNPVSSLFAAQAITIILDVLPRLYESPNDVTLRDSMMQASVYAGLAFSNTKTALAHSISYYLTANYNTPHGIACGFSIPKILGAVLRKQSAKRIMESALGNCEILVQRLHEFFQSLEVSTDIFDYVDTLDDIHKSLAMNDRVKNSLVAFEEVRW